MADKGRTVKVYDDTLLPNGVEVAAGEYTIHVDETSHEVQFLQKGKVIAKAPCNCIGNKEKNQRTEIQYKKTADGKTVLQQLKVGGDNKTIVLEGEAM